MSSESEPLITKHDNRVRMNVSEKSEPSAKFQYFATFVVCLLIFGYSVFDSWNVTNILLFTSDKTPLPFGKISMEQMSWVTSLESAGVVVGVLGFGYITNLVGRKPPLLIIGTLIFVRKHAIFNVSKNSCQLTFFSDFNVIGLVRTKCVVFVHGSYFGRAVWWRRIHHFGAIHQ